MHRIIFKVFILAGTLTYINSAQSKAGDGEKIAVGCGKAATTFPVAHQPTASQRAQLANCDAGALYYGLGMPIEKEQARLCAYATQNFPVLLMVYANGEGVPQDYSVARKIACEMPRTAQLQAAEKEAGATGSDTPLINALQAFDAYEKLPASRDAEVDSCELKYLDAKTCRAAAEKYVAERLRQMEAAVLEETSGYERKWDEVSANWPEQHREKLQGLRAKLRMRIEDRLREIDSKIKQGFYRRTGQLSEISDQYRRFDLHLEEAEEYSAKKGRRMTAGNADKELNVLLTRFRTDPNILLYNTYKYPTFQENQGRWLEFRAEFVDFFRLRYPRIAAGYWTEQLAVERIAELKNAAGMPDASTGE